VILSKPAYPTVSAIAGRVFALLGEKAAQKLKTFRSCSIGEIADGSAFADELQFAEISLQQLLQFAWPRHNNAVSCDAQKLLVAKFCQSARQRFTRCSHFSGEHAFRSVEFDLNLRRADGPRALF